MTGPVQRTWVDSRTPWEGMAGYARAVRIGDRILVSGTTATDDKGQLVGGDDAAAQTDYIIQKLERALQTLGGELKDVVRTRMFVADIAHWEPVAQAHGRRFGEIRPVTTLVEAKLVGPEYLVEIEAEAVLGVESSGPVSW